MEAVPFRQLEDAVISTNAGFGPLVDSKHFVVELKNASHYIL